MALYGFSFTHSSQTPYLQNHQSSCSPIPRTPPTSPIFSALTPLSLISQKPNTNDKLPLRISKRILNLTILTVILADPLSRFSKAMAEELQLQAYTDSKEGFMLLKPTSWVKVDKAGATVLFEDANKGANNIGVVVSPVRLNNLGEFGSPQFVADKLIKAEKRKESTKGAEVIAFLERLGHEGLQVYEFEYKLDSSRGGMKRIFSAAFVANKKLYLLNISHSDNPESPLDTHRRTILEQVLHSFDAAPTT